MTERHPDDNTIALFAARYLMNSSRSDAAASVLALQSLVPGLGESTRAQIAREAREDVDWSAATPAREAWATVLGQLEEPSLHTTSDQLPVADAEEVLLLNALRYALPRMSTASMIVSDRILDRWDDLSSAIRDQVSSTIADALKNDRAGQACDQALWRKVLARARQDRQQDVLGPGL